MKKRKQQAKNSSEPVPVTPGPPPQPGAALLRMILKDQRGTDATIAAIAALAKKIPCSPDIIDAIIFFDHYITPTMAQRLEKHVGKTASEWLEMDKKYQGYREAEGMSGNSQSSGQW